MHIIAINNSVISVLYNVVVVYDILISVSSLKFSDENFLNKSPK